MTDLVYKDFLNRELTIGNYVVFPAPYGNGMKLGKIIRFTPRQIRVEWTYKVRDGEIRTRDAARYSKECVKVEGEDLTMYLLTGDY